MFSKKPTPILSLLISIILSTAPLNAQQEKAPAPATPAQPAKDAPQKEPAFTVDTLLAADSYKVYGEVRNVGQVVRSANVADVLEPIMKLAGPPKEFKSMVRFANAHADSLESCRLVFAAWPVRPKLPQFLFAIEFASPEEAGKFEAPLRDFLPTVLPPPTPTPTPKADPVPPAAATSAQPATTPPSAAQPAQAPAVVKPATTAVKETESKPAPPFVIKQSGSLVLVSDTAFTFKSLRPPDSKLLAEDENFRQARDRFASDPIFVFFNVALEDKPLTAAVGGPEAKTAETEMADDSKPDTDEESDDSAAAEVMVSTEAPEPPPPAVSTGATAPTELTSTVIIADNGSTVPGTTVMAGPDPAYFVLMGALFGGEPKWPEAVSAAISFEGDTYVVHVLVENGLNARGVIIPFVPQVVSGPALTLESPSILPSDTEFLVAASLDAPQIYEGLVKTVNDQNARFQKTSRGRAPQVAPEAPFASLEKKLGVKIKEELLPVLGNELAVSVPVNLLGEIPGIQSGPPRNDKKTDGSQPDAKTKPSPVVVISLKDKEAARTLVPKIIDGLGFKGASMLAQSEKRDDTEIVSYAGAFAYAFVGNFLVLAADVAAIRHVTDSYLNHQTLASDTNFRNFTRWQPRQVLGQIYVSPALMNYRAYADEPTALISDKLREFLLKLSPMAEPVTYSVSNEGSGPLHQLHVPKNLLLMAVASASDESNQSPLMRNEGIARTSLALIAGAEERYRADHGKGKYATLDQLIELGFVHKEMWQDNGYRIELTINGVKFEATAMPIEYGKTGRLSYFVDESAVVRGADRGGAPATVADRQVQ